MQELIKIQSRIKAPKSRKNEFGNFDYRNCEDILEAAKPLLDEYQCLLILFDEIIALADKFFIKSTARITNSTKEVIETYGFAKLDETKKGMDDAQRTGSSSSYARKYALNGLFLIDNEKDPDSMLTTSPNMPPVQVAPTIVPPPPLLPPM